MKAGEPDPFAPGTERPTVRDDPFARAYGVDAKDRGAAREPERSVAGKLAQRDPLASPESSTDFPLLGATSVDDLLKRERKRGFWVGSAAGALTAIALAVVVAAVLSRATLPPSPRAATPPPRDSQPPLAATTSTPFAGPPLQSPSVARAKSPAAHPPARRPIALIPRAPELVVGPDLASGTGLGAAGSTPTAAPATPMDGGSQEPYPPEPASPPREPVSSQAAAHPRQIERGEVAAALAARRDAIDGCFAATPDEAAGTRDHRFVLSVTIDGSGTVIDARVDGARAGSTLSACLTRVARGITLAPFDGEPVQVELPLRYAGEG